MSSDLVQELETLKTWAETAAPPVEEIQRRLSAVLLAYCEAMNIEKDARRFDNRLEIVIYTLKPENQLEAAIGVIGEAIEFAKCLENKAR